MNREGVYKFVGMVKNMKKNCWKNPQMKNMTVTMKMERVVEDAVAKKVLKARRKTMRSQLVRGIVWNVCGLKEDF